MRSKSDRKQMLKRFDWLPHTGVYNVDKLTAEDKKHKKAPFSAVLHDNPYAWALAQPSRECTFTNARLPRSCMIDFHVVDAGDPLGESSLGGGLQLLPLSLAADLVPRKKSEAARSPAERSAVARVQEERRSPEGARAGHMVLQRTAVKWVSDHIKKNVFSHGVSVRARMRLAQEGLPERLGWRTDMHDVVLNGLRRVLWARIKFFFNSKKNADSEGLLIALPAGTKFTHVHGVERAGCVLRLRKEAGSTPVMPEVSQLARRAIMKKDGQICENETGKLEYADLREAQEEYKRTIAERKANNMENEAKYDAYDMILGKASAPNSSPETSSEQDVDGAEVEAEVDTADSQQPSSTPDEDRHANDKLGSATWQSYDSAFKRDEEMRTPWMAGLGPLPPPSHPFTVYYPTVRYRNGRIPLYDLPRLLGDDIMSALLENSVFKDVEYVVVANAKGTLDALTQLIRLHTYIGLTKEESEMA